MTQELKDPASTAQARRDSSSSERDRIQLERLGKKPVLKRNFGIWAVLGLSCTVLGTWEGLLGTFTTSLNNGGSAGAVAPTSGGQYHWCAMLAPNSCMKFLSYITGWVTVIGWQAGLASSAYLAGSMIQGVAILAHKNYDSKAWQGTLIMWACLLVALAINLAGGKIFPRLEQGILVLHILGCLAIIMPLVCLADHRSNQEVFQEFLNSGEFPTQGLSWFVGVSGCAFSFAGGDAVVHMAEEIHNAAIVIPRAMMLSVLINGILGFGMLIAMLFSMGDIEVALNSPTGYPFMEIFYQSTHSTAGAVVMSTILITIGIFGVIGILAAASRQFWSFARDRAVPGWRLWVQVSSSTRLPIYSTLLTVAVAWLLALINIGSGVALEDILSMAVSGMYLSYLIVSSLLLYRRCKGDIYGHNDTDGAINVPGARLVWGPFHLPGLLGAIVNAYAVVYIVIVVFFSFWPPHMMPTVTTMNYSVVGTFGTIILAAVYYLVRARKMYTGPVLET
ncbi:amino acid/polyamine transporter I [Penicillium soppii]|uniref:amino acid/polyamine transporter I n=1 Tax=Penicillium soppii TaxID=69789 RepID=UPI002548DB07|nr:amino acid/polyamine transporter I [Penicillium soppii]KAJ5860478.1 amino acid/polyamine transporter I [Penicillium soppii]